MTIIAMASLDACDACVENAADETVFWLEPRGTRPAGVDKAAQKFRHLTTSLGLSAFLTLGTASTALAPAAASTSDSITFPPLPEPTTLAAVDLAGLAGSASSLGDMGIGIELPEDVLIQAEPASETAQIEIEPPEAVAAAPIAVTGERIVHSTAVTEPADANMTGYILSTASIRVSSEINLAGGIDYRPPPDLNELLEFDGMRVPRWLVETILHAADATDVDPVYLMALADKESSFIPAVKAKTSSAQGLFQFISSTWLEVVRSFGGKYGLAAEAAAIEVVNGQLTIEDEELREHVLGLRRDSYLSALMAAEMMKRDRAKLERRVGRPINRSEFYLAHFFGVDSAGKFMALLDNKPKQSAPRSFPAAARANKALFFAKQGRKTRQLSLAEVFDKIDEMIDRRLERYEDVKTIAMADIDL